MIQSLTLNLGRRFFELFRFLGGLGMMLSQTLREITRRPFYFRLILDQVYQLGVRSIPLVIVTAASTGMVMTLQFGLGLEKFGGKLYVPKIVSLSIVRELGPVFASLMLAARIGAGIASEIGSMKVTQQIDAIRALGTSPIKKIVIPKVLACLIAIPLLTVFANTVGIAGGTLVGSSELGLDPSFYINKAMATVTIADYMTGLAKTFFFALFISLPACYYGMTVTGGTRGVGSATTKAVVTASILILISDFFLTKLLWVVETWMQ
jgi:phospholipid/cholesterol/gamma-HCH transport system permease protein